MADYKNIDESFSERLSNVLDEIGINDDVIQRRRQTYLHLEQLYGIHFDTTVTYFFGSQTEGTTTIDLRSDIDKLWHNKNEQVIQSKPEADLGKINYLAVKDGNTAPGYCRIYLLDGQNIPYGQSRPYNLFYVNDNGNKCILNSISHTVFDHLPRKGQLIFKLEFQRKGPSKGEKCMNIDDVEALAFASWPSESKSLIFNESKEKWPSKEMLRHIRCHTCFLVPVGCRQSDRKFAEWRISYSLTERFLMFSLNNIQLQCYVVLKSIQKRFLGKKISSYHLKNILFTIVARTRHQDWTYVSLFIGVLLCLKTLRMMIQAGYCPQFINPSVNLFQRKLSVKQRNALCQRIITLTWDNNKYACIFRINTDQVGRRMMSKYQPISTFSLILSKIQIVTHIKQTLRYTLKNYKAFLINDILTYEYDISHDNSQLVNLKEVCKILKILKCGSLADKAAAMNLLPGTLGQMVAIATANRILNGELIDENILWYLKFATIHDRFSFSLKLATIYYKLGNMNDALNVIKKLEDIITALDGTLVSVCWTKVAEWTGEILKSDVRFAECVRFLRQEISICPYPLIYEMYRTTKYDKPYRISIVHNWMDTAEIDPMNYLFLLKYLVYQALNENYLAEEAMVDMSKYASRLHPETKLNVIGQWFENNGNVRPAVRCYVLSLKTRPRNNAAKWLLALLVYRQIRKKEKEIEL